MGSSGISTSAWEPAAALLRKALAGEAERQGFEPWIRFWRIRTFQARSLNHSDISPLSPVPRSNLCFSSKAAAKVKTSAAICKIVSKQILRSDKSYFCVDMKFSFFDRLLVRQVFTVAVLSGAVLNMFPPATAAFKWWAAQAQWVAVGYLFGGIFFLIINRMRLMFVCLGCSAAISFFYNEAKIPQSPPVEPLEQNDSLPVQN